MTIIIIIIIIMKLDVNWTPVEHLNFSKWLDCYYSESIYCLQGPLQHFGMQVVSTATHVAQRKFQKTTKIMSLKLII